MNSLKSLERFWAKVDTGSSNCWVWRGVTHRQGYGTLGYRGNTVFAHRFAWQDVMGPIPSEMDVLHKCDNPPCVNPKHLFLGTHQDNMADMVAKGRAASGENLPISKLTWNQVREIRESSLGYSKLAKVYGVDQKTIRCVKKEITWKVPVKKKNA